MRRAAREGQAGGVEGAELHRPAAEGHGNCGRRSDARWRASAHPERCKIRVSSLTPSRGEGAGPRDGGAGGRVVGGAAGADLAEDRILALLSFSPEPVYTHQAQMDTDSVWPVMLHLKHFGARVSMPCRRVPGVCP